MNRLTLRLPETLHQQLVNLIELGCVMLILGVCGLALLCYHFV